MISKIPSIEYSNLVDVPPQIPHEHAPPNPSAIVESLRGVGYSLATAIADIIDNSIAAKARNVNIDFHWGSEASWIRISDDGVGMDEREMHRAMTLGGKSPLDERPAHDLGRFGLGLKTASFSQCRCLTVASKKNNKMVVRQWDLDHIARTQEWQLLTTVSGTSSVLISNLDTKVAGTVVLWENLDRIVSPGLRGEDAFLKAIDEVEAHISMVFHRFLEGVTPQISLFINGDSSKERVRTWDPFMLNHPSTIQRPTQPIQSESGTITIKGFVLPHKDKLNAEQSEEGGGPEGWTAQQGFYVYRNERLLVAGSWLGLGSGRAWTKEEAHKLARIRLDITNQSDNEWKIDIKKSVARPPSEIRQALRAIAEDVRKTARNVFAHRGEYGSGHAIPDLMKTWIVAENGADINYRINRKHPLIAKILNADKNRSNDIDQMLSIIEKTVPVQRIWLDVVEKGEVQINSFEGKPSEEICSLINILYFDMRKRVGLGEKQAKNNLLKTEPFNQFPDYIKELPGLIPAESE